MKLFKTPKDAYEAIYKYCEELCNVKKDLNTVFCIYEDLIAHGYEIRSGFFTDYYEAQLFAQSLEKTYKKLNITHSTYLNFNYYTLN